MTLLYTFSFSPDLSHQVTFSSDRVHLSTGGGHSHLSRASAPPQFPLPRLECGMAELLLPSPPPPPPYLPPCDHLPVRLATVGAASVQRSLLAAVGLSVAACWLAGLLAASRSPPPPRLLPQGSSLPCWHRRYPAGELGPSPNVTRCLCCPTRCRLPCPAVQPG